MKVLADPVDEIPAVLPPKIELTFPTGIIGFPEHRRGEIFHLPDQLPFQWLRLHGPTVLHFVVIDPAGAVPDYAPELYDDDARALGINGAEDALVFNIVTERADNQATINLVGPLVINRGTGVGRQIVVANHNQFDARHPLVTAS